MIIFHADKSSTWGGLRFERDGQPVTIEEALKEGFTILPNDAPMAATLLQRFIQTREECAK